MDLADLNGVDMNISPSDFHIEAYKLINTTITGAKEYGIDIYTLPPHLSIMTGKDLCDNKFALSAVLPEILQDIDPDLWPFIAHQKMHEETNSIGFAFWCLVEDSDTGVQSIFGMSYLKEQGFKGFLSDIYFQSEPEILTDLHLFIPSFLHYDFDVDCVVH